MGIPYRPLILTAMIAAATTLSCGGQTGPATIPQLTPSPSPFEIQITIDKSVAPSDYNLGANIKEVEGFASLIPEHPLNVRKQCINDNVLKLEDDVYVIPLWDEGGMLYEVIVHPIEYKDKHLEEITNAVKDCQY